MLVVHLTLTPLAGAPIRIVNALNEHTDIEARLVNYSPFSYGARIFPEDLDWNKYKDEAKEFISKADIIHMHHYLNLEESVFGNLKKLNPKAKFIRHFHSNINFVSKFSGVSVKSILEEDIPKLVIPHYPERSFPNARIVPNIIPINDDLYLPKQVQNSKPMVFYSPTLFRSAWKTRWATKGYPEVLSVFNRLRKYADFKVVYNTPFEECMKLKQYSDIIVDDIVTGSYHLTALEGLSQGKPVLSYLDSQSQSVLFNLLGVSELPFVNVRVEESAEVLKLLCFDNELREDLGKYSRNWIEKYYDDRNLVKHFCDVYKDILNDEFKNEDKFLDFKKAKEFLYHDSFDIIQKERAKNYKKSLAYRLEAFKQEFKHKGFKTFLD